MNQAEELSIVAKESLKIMSRTLRVYWWNQGPRAGNFGDELGPALIRILARSRVEWAPPEMADIISIGSVLEPWFWKNTRSFSGIVWGSGRMYGSESFSLASSQISLLRGPLTLKSFGGDNSIPLGDPGLLADIFLKKRDPKYALGLVPHWSQFEHLAWTRLAAHNTHLIDVCSGYEQVISQIAQCEAIVSSSLHGLIVADSLGIPNVWVTLGDDPTYPNQDFRFKFADYYASLGITEMDVVDISKPTTVRKLQDRAMRQKSKELRKVKERIWNSFPL
ncbi:polysaccharide pyruvyl transferase family protein [Bremerella sp. T1]|uniref:polysaccharide pyruvyl transferase family protein n=1 Tax=Bremerella sp. TYQ1 TaxID=3119568 RepID=UPI001CCB9434|nr:polysaccharide pyruvyl transferase family protein [Bremerella volcania]UBM37662.1 polysaccharide pyruvyl transferase family protein [Bremerella volcania]